MDIFSVFTLCGGLAFFLFGMHIMSSSLEKIAGGKLELTLKKLTSNPFKSLLLGAGITIAIQSSSAMTVMLVGLVNSGIMELSQTVGLIMGSNIGTTLTAWILSMAGIEGDNLLISMLKPEELLPDSCPHRRDSDYGSQKREEKGHRLHSLRLCSIDVRHGADEKRHGASD